MCGKEEVKEYAHRHFLVASHCNAQKELSVPVLVNQLIDAAVEHANRLGVGYADLRKIGAAWVLSRISLFIERMPRIESTYVIITWVEQFNKMFSHRNFVILDGDEKPIVWARSLWVGIDVETRRPVDLSVLVEGRDIISGREMPYEALPKLRPLSPEDIMGEYRFTFTDIDFNRHVNSTRYVEVILNRWSLAHYDSNRIAGFDISFRHEAHYGDVATVYRRDCETLSDVELRGEGATFCIARIKWEPAQ